MSKDDSADKLDSSADDHVVVRRVLAGNKDEFRHIVTNHKNMIFGVIYRQVGERELAQELCQEVFVKAFLNLNRFRFESRLSTWLVTIALNHTTSFFQSKRFKTAKKTDQLDITKHDTAHISMDEQQEKKQIMQNFREALATLKPMFREVIVLCGLEGKSYEEAASALKIPVGTVRSRLNKARLLLKEHLGEYAG